MANNGRKIAAGVGAVSALAVSGAALASSQTVSTGTSTPNATTQQSSATDQRAHGMRGLHDELVTGAAATNVKNAVKAKDASITVKGVRQASDGSYRAFGTKAGKRVMVEVSKDLKTVTVRTGSGHGGPGERGGHGHHRGTEVTGTTLTTVKNAIKAKDSAVTVEKVFKGSDGTYRAFGTKAGKRVMVEVSKDLKTVTVKAGMPGGPDGRRPGGQGGPDGRGGARPGAGAPDAQAPQGGSTGSDSSGDSEAPSSSSASAQAA